jgi:hypothetical protein
MVADVAREKENTGLLSALLAGLRCEMSIQVDADKHLSVR